MADLPLTVAVDALHCLPADTDRDSWVRRLMAAKAAGVDERTAREWSAQAGNFDAAEFSATWRSIRPNGGIGPGTLIHEAQQHGFVMPLETNGFNGQANHAHANSHARNVQDAESNHEGPEKALRLWNAGEDAARHAYVLRKRLVVTARAHLRVVDVGRDAWRLAVPLFSVANGGLLSLQLIDADGGKKNLHGAALEDGAHRLTNGEVMPEAVLYVCEGYASADAVARAVAGKAHSFCTVGVSRFARVGRALRVRYPESRIVLIPDRGAEAIAQKAARACDAEVATLPQDAPEGFDAWDHADKHGPAQLYDAVLMQSRPPEPAPVIEKVSGPVPPEIASHVKPGGTLTEDAAAVLFAAQWQGQICFNAQQGRWYVWTGTHWRTDERGAVIERVRAKLRELMPKSDARVHGARMVHNVATLAQSDVRLLPSGEFDGDAWAIGTPAGVINLRDGSMRPACPADLITRVTGCAPDFERDCPRWREFLNTCAQGDAELIAFLQKLCGYALTGSTSYEFVFVLYGPGANGKTRLLTAIREILGDYFIALPPETFLQSAHEQHPAGIARLQGARLAAVSELPANRSWNSQRVKDISSGERIAARYMRQNFFEFVPVCKLLFVGNHRPRLQQVDEAERRRFRLIPFLHRVPENQRDPELEAKLREEYPAIAAWMVEGAKRLHAEGFGAMPKAVKEASQDYFSESDTLATWADERLTFDPVLTARAGTLHDDYRRWFEDNGHDGRPMSTNELKQRLIHDYDARYERDKRGRYFRGVALRYEE
ncbi:MAG TPA: phage/plasmid primase, P4 family [Paraburkholderia sp.]|jgi:putative DNA primase/helicase